MELIYSMRRKPLKFPPPHFENSLDSGVIRSICTISSANIIAFSSPTELSDSDGNTWAGHVYVCDLDTPWDSHKVTSTSYSVSALEWDNEGKQLLVATTEGDVSVYGQKDYLLNEWQCLYTAQFPGEHIIKAVFFHNGRRFVMMDKKPDAPITERIQMTRSTPTLKGFGGVACEGAVVLTASGLVATLVAADGPRALLASEPLRSRHHILCADLAHKAGNVIVAAAGKTAVRCYVCAVTRSPGRPPAAALQVQPLPTVFLPVDHAPPVSVTWCLREDTDSLMIASNKLSLWKLTERSHPVHKLLAKGTLQGSTTPGGGQKQASDCFNTVAWVQAGTVAVEGRAVQAACGRPAPAPPLALLATARALHLLARDSHHYVCSRQVVTTGSGEPAGAATPPKKPKYGPGLVNDGNGGQAVVSSVQISSLGGVAVCVDSHAQLHVFRLPQPWADIPSPMSLQQATSVLEYAMVSGYDCLDVLLTLKPNMMETVYERLTESFQRQPQHFQQYYYHSWLKLRTALCRAVPTWQNGAAWLATVGWLHAAAAAAASAVRDGGGGGGGGGAGAGGPEGGELAALAALLDDSAPDVASEKLLAGVEAGGEAAPLPALRRPLQRALDAAVTALAALPHHHHHHAHGYDILTDPSALCLLRKLVVVARGGEALSRPLARLATAAQPKQDLLDECAALCAQRGGARVWDALPRCAVSAPHQRPWPLHLEYGVEPEALRYNPEPPAYAQGDTTPSTNMDSIRYMYLGGGRRAARWRACARCGARALAPALPARPALQRAHDARFLPACRCGGKWTLFSNV
ncbi:mediator of RNA polymerase II transcription subunit 16 [Galleria mellonella]|uniref:Mediator of RNA polymerase II transcription subunit 16 n=1 Tax=Galleria mellonella TaxID=7137 RepID=A0ABM3MS42_GALME|nr:mediator of RNA polymerase II transcription subunit 16 [Galleria mellonella]